jgi:hypothetical protein
VHGSCQLKNQTIRLVVFASDLRLLSADNNRYRAAQLWMGDGQDGSGLAAKTLGSRARAQAAASTDKQAPRASSPRGFAVLGFGMSIGDERYATLQNMTIEEQVQTVMLLSAVDEPRSNARTSVPHRWRQ